ncbi:alpha/beta hydrolase [Flavobacterium nackdongense]|uniref:Alpha/beta hydrolase n=1 Tax=Flavobacterium nackdongense TaxID=2547394 RepID=A0A4P6YCD8_9FLAO|nr:alpha/beta hydrolase [Flavobacterium nackdongense]QBN18484.1 alpha/beta hydrolase [Flavobacterium nackdongense]
MDLEDKFNYHTINLKNDYEGKVIATLISSKSNTDNRSPVLYIHGFIDYFFHPHLAEEFHKNGYDFYALELRKYGHSLQGHQHPNYCKSIEEYFEEISIAIQSIYDKSQKKMVLMGHSTGGLITSLYMNLGNKRDLVCGLVLNSPFLELNMPPLARILAPAFAKIISFIAPFSKLNKAISPVYGQSVHKNYFGEWDFNLKWKPINGFPAYFAWFVAVVNAQNLLKQKSSISVPILVLFSSNSLLLKKYTPEAQTADIVLNVKQIKKIGRNLGSNVTLQEINNGMHDLFLSKKEVRNLAFTALFDWISAQEKKFKH